MTRLSVKVRQLLDLVQHIDVIKVAMARTRTLKVASFKLLARANLWQLGPIRLMHDTAFTETL